MQSDRICIMGLGYIGLPTAAMLAVHGFRVHGVDVDPVVVDGISKKELNLKEPGLSAFVRDALETRNLTVSTEPTAADVFIICVPTPLDKESKNADLSYVINAVNMIAPALQSGNLVILESTIPPGTTREKVIPILESTGIKVGEGLFVSYCPERVMPGNILSELVENDRIIGGIDASSAKMAETLYSSFVKGKILLTDSTTAEAVKLMENTYRDINIALANELAKLGTQLGIDTWEALRLANRHPRVNILSPGPGVGGHCIAVDPWFLHEKDPKTAELIASARKVNDSMPAFVADRISALLEGIVSPRVAALGLAYKANVNDTRESPAIAAVEVLKQRGIEVKACDPLLDDQDGLFDLETVANDTDCLVMFVNHSVFSSVKPGIGERMRTKNLLDCSNSLDHKGFEDAGFNVEVLGIGKMV